ncbi:MAG: hypothetical protein KC448_14325 [Yoonia sp.]|nr:hypothetical protein [Yoonia sp.]
MKAILILISAVVYCSAALSEEMDTTTAALGDNPFAFAGSSLTFGVAQISQSGEFVASGPSLGYSIAGKIDVFETLPLYVEWTGSHVAATDFSANTSSQDLGPDLFTSSTSPSGTIDLSAFTDATGAMSDVTIQITDSTGEIASIISSAFSPSGPENAISQFALSETDVGGIFTALTTNGDLGTAAAYGVVFDDTGFLFMGSGDESSAAITTSVKEQISASSQSLFLSTGLSWNDDWMVTPKIGPVFRRIDRTRTLLTSIDINEGFESATATPDILLSETTSLRSKYYGAVLGTDLTRQFGNNWWANFGAEAGLAHFKAKYASFEAANIGEASAVTPNINMAMTGTSKMGRITGGVTHVGRNGTIMSVSAFWDVMSDVPYVVTQTVESPNLNVVGDNASLVGSGETYRTHTIERKKMTSAGINLSLVFLF